MSADRSSTGRPPNTPDGTDATADAPVDGDAPGRNADPDLITDEDLKKGDER
jgi:hypothetical protein